MKRTSPTMASIIDTPPMMNKRVVNSSRESTIDAVIPIFVELSQRDCNVEEIFQVLPNLPVDIRSRCVCRINLFAVVYVNALVNIHIHLHTAEEQWSHNSTCYEDSGQASHFMPPHLKLLDPNAEDLTPGSKRSLWRSRAFWETS